MYSVHVYRKTHQASFSCIQSISLSKNAIALFEYIYSEHKFIYQETQRALFVCIQCMPIIICTWHATYLLPPRDTLHVSCHPVARYMCPATPWHATIVSCHPVTLHISCHPVTRYMSPATSWHATIVPHKFSQHGYTGTSLFYREQEQQHVQFVTVVKLLKLHGYRA